MAITVNRATLARQVNGEIEYIYPKTYADMVEYDENQTVQDKIDSMAEQIDNGEIDVANKVDKPLDKDGNLYNGEKGQVLETNGDGTTSWVSRARVYVGTDEMPEGYDVQINPTATTIEIDRTLSVDGGIAEASATGAAIKLLNNKIDQLHSDAQAEAIQLDDLTESVNGAKDYILFRDVVTKYIYTVRVENGVLVCVSRCVGISVTTQPTKTEYEVGEIFNPAGMVVSAVCENGATREIIDYVYDKFAITENTTSIQIAYIENGITFVTNVPITINNDPVGISVTTQPNKTQYEVGETFNATGMVVTLTYEDGTTKEVTDYSYPTTALIGGTKSVTITYTEDGDTFTTIVPVTVVVRLSSLAVTTQPIKTEYTEGEVFNSTGMVVTAKYNDGTSKEVTGYSLTYLATPVS